MTAHGCTKVCLPHRSVLPFCTNRGLVACTEYGAYQAAPASGPSLISRVLQADSTYVFLSSYPCPGLCSYLRIPVLFPHSALILTPTHLSANNGVTGRSHQASITPSPPAQTSPVTTSMAASTLVRIVLRSSMGVSLALSLYSSYPLPLCSCPSLVISDPPSLTSTSPKPM